MAESTAGPSRRDVVYVGLGVAAASFLTACCRIRPATLPFAAAPPAIYPQIPGAIAIDVHCHVFNGTDLQVNRFLTLNQDVPGSQELKNIITALLQFLNWNAAPTGCDEYRVLADRSIDAATTERHRQAAYNNFRKSVRATPVYKEATARSAAAGVTAQPSAATPLIVADEHTQYLIALKALIDAPTLGDYEATLTALTQGAGSRALPNIDNNQLKRVLAFLQQGFNYRYINVLDYLHTYNPPDSTGRSLDIMISNLVDYDWPLAMGKKTRTPFPDQIDVMERLSIFTHGRVHAMAPFDPMREVAEDAGFHPSHGAGPHFPLTSLQDAVLNRGFVGVKLYPVMGFRPANNAALPSSTWQKSWLPSWMTEHITIAGRTQSCGAWMDEKLEKLYQWCEDNDVPITLHADNTQGPDRFFDTFPFDASWADVFARHPKLRVNFGHAGSPTSVSGLYEQITPNMKLGNHVYGDLSYPGGALDAPANLAATLKNILTTQPTDLHDHVMYGTDWLMLIIANNSESCLRIFEQALTQLDQTPHPGPSYADRFFAGNAIEFLGLARGSVTRCRLEAFYHKSGLDLTSNPPVWMSKVDAMHS